MQCHAAIKRVRDRHRHGGYHYQYNAQRTGANIYETTLTPANVNESLFGKIFSCGVDSYIYGQPLFMPKLGISGSTHQVCSMMKSTVPGARLL